MSSLDLYILNIYTIYMPNYMIYIAKAPNEQFKQEPNKSGLINDLLLRHYGKAPSSLQKHYPERYEQKKVVEQPEEDESDPIFGYLDPDNLVIAPNSRVYDKTTGEEEEVTRAMVNELRKRGQVQ